MSRKHFITLAKSLASIRPNQTTQPRNYRRWLDAVAQLMLMCRSLNPAFDPDRFLEACHAVEPGQEEWPVEGISAIEFTDGRVRAVVVAHA